MLRRRVADHVSVKVVNVMIPKNGLMTDQAGVPGPVL